MIELGAIAKSIAFALGLAAVQGTLLALVAVIAVRTLRPTWQAAVWLVVLAKFALPWSPALPWSLADVFAALGAHTESGALVLPNPTRAASADAGSLAASLGWLALVLVWAAGSAIVISRAIAAQRQATRMARAGRVVRDPLLAELAAVLGVRTPTLVIGDPAHGPFVVGLVHATIVVPPQLLADRGLLRAALLHELAHVRRRDALGRLVQLAATALMWWWPVARLASRRLELAREAACDAWALDHCDVSPPAYARLLVRMARLGTSAAPMLAAPHALDARVAAVLGPRRHARVGLAGRVLLAILALVALGGARSAAARGEKSPCVYTPRLAEALRQAYPEADLDGDGVLSRDEACDLQAALRRAPTTATPEPARLASFRDEPLGCNYDQSNLIPTEPPVCPEGPEGVDR